MNINERHIHFHEFCAQIHSSQLNCIQFNVVYLPAYILIAHDRQCAIFDCNSIVYIIEEKI